MKYLVLLPVICAAGSFSPKPTLQLFDLLRDFLLIVFRGLNTRTWRPVFPRNVVPGDFGLHGNKT